MGTIHETLNMEGVEKIIEEHGLSGIKNVIKAKLEGWKDIEINVGIIGSPGVGKSSFVNAIRGIADDNEVHAAETGVTECTRNATDYHHPDNDKIIFWDLPGIGTPNCPDLEKVDLEKYDTFLIFTAGRFTNNDLDLAKKVKSMKKSFFFIRTKIDQDRANEKRRKKERFDEQAMLKKIKDECLVNLRGLQNGDKVVFLISNHDPTKWDFVRLKKEIIAVLSDRKGEYLTLFLERLISLSSDSLKRKAKIIRDEIWKAASASAVGALVPVPGVSVAVDLKLITKELKLYITQLGLPADETSPEFKRMSSKNQERVAKYFITSMVQVATLMATYAASSTAEEVSRSIPGVGSAIAGVISFSATYYFLYQCLNKLEKTSLSELEEMKKKAEDEIKLLTIASSRRKRVEEI